MTQVDVVNYVVYVYCYCVICQYEVIVVIIKIATALHETNMKIYLLLKNYHVF